MERPLSAMSASHDSVPSTSRAGESGSRNDSYVYEDGYDSEMALSRSPNENFKVIQGC